MTFTLALVAVRTKVCRLQAGKVEVVVGAGYHVVGGVYARPGGFAGQQAGGAGFAGTP